MNAKMSVLAVLLAASLGASSLAGQTCSNNSLRNTEELDAPTWDLDGGTIQADLGCDPLGGDTADLLTTTDPEASYLAEESDVAASAGGRRNLIYPVSDWNRYYISASIDGTQWVCSVYLRRDTELIPVYVVLDVAEGMIRCGVRDYGPGDPLWVWGFQLEPGFSPHPYHHRASV